MQSSTNMIVGALIGIIIMAGTVVIGCALSMSRRRKAGAEAPSAPVQAAVQPTPSVKIKREKPPRPPRAQKALKVREPRAPKPPKAEKPPRPPGKLSSFMHREVVVGLAPSKEIPRPAAQAQVPEVMVQQAEPALTAPVASSAPDVKPAKAKKEKPPRVEKARQVKEPKLPKQKAVKESKPEAEKKAGFGLFGKRKAPGAQPEAVRQTAAKAEAGTPDVDVNAHFVMPHVSAVQSEGAPLAPPTSLQMPGAAPAAQAPQSSTSAASTPGAPAQAAASAAAPPPAPAPEKKDEEVTDSVFNLFTDTEGEESEISKFAANFENVEMDALLGTGQDLLGRLAKK